MSKVNKELNNPNVVATDEEEADIAKGWIWRVVLIYICLAIALSLSEQKQSSPAFVAKEEPKKK